MRTRPPTSREIRELIDDYGFPVRLTVNDNVILTLGWLDDEDRENPALAIRELLRDVVTALDESTDDD